MLGVVSAKRGLRTYRLDGVSRLNSNEGSFAGRLGREPVRHLVLVPCLELMHSSLRQPVRCIYMTTGIDCESYGNGML